MKNRIALLVLIFVCSCLYAQTDSIEEALLYEKVLLHEISPEDFSKIAVKWRETVNETNKYPELPFDQKGEVYYSFLTDFKGNSMEVLFDRSMEWLAINYGLIPAYLYANKEDGKIIFKNSFDIASSNYTCNFTGIITVKNDKMVMEFMSIAYQQFFSAHYVDDVWVSDKTINVGFKNIYPIILKKASEWNSNLNILRNTDEQFTSEVISLRDYIDNYDSVYKF
jgi:hypothetical protein